MKTYEELAVELAAACQRREYLNEEWNVIQERISSLITALGCVSPPSLPVPAPLSMDAETEIFEVPPHVRLRHSEVHLP